MRQETICYQADGLVLKSQLFLMDAPGPRAGVLVFPEAFGLGRNVIRHAKRLAALGYVALACDLHGEGRFVDDLDDALTLLKPLFDNPLRTRARASAGLQALAARPEIDPTRIAAISFCFPMSLELARSGANLRAAVGFHTLLTTSAPSNKVGAINARVLVCVGADDPFIPADQRTSFEAEMRGAGTDWQMHVYGRTVHSFTSQDAPKRNRPDAIRYSAEAEKRSWSSMLELFTEVLGPSTAIVAEGA